MLPSIYDDKEVHLLPVVKDASVSVLIPFNPKMTPKHIITNRLKEISNKINNQLIDSENKNADTLKQLKKSFSNLDYTTYTQSIYLYADNTSSFTLYLYMDVEENITFNANINMRNVVQHRREDRAIILVCLFNKTARIYMVNESNISKLSEIRNNNFTEGEYPEQFFRRIDGVLHHLLNAWNYPAVIGGDETIIPAYLLQSNNNILTAALNKIDEKTEPEIILETVQLILKQWNILKEMTLLNILEKAYLQNHCVVGIEKVHEATQNKKIKLLMVEEDYLYPALIGITDENSSENAIYVNDLVEEIIEKVLIEGGEVRMVGKHSLLNMQHIAAII